MPSPPAIEDKTSRALHASREGGRRLKHHRSHHHHKSHHDEKKYGPRVQHDTQHGMMIDAGSTGTRIHVYEYAPRILSTRKQVKHAVNGRKLSFPTTDTRWTERLKPGLDAFAFVEDPKEMTKQVHAYLQPLLDFAKEVLSTKSKNWKNYPIYLKATGGLRTLPRPYRIRLIDTVRKLFHNSTINPFFFEDEHARVISGEEEAIYGWTAVNFVKGTLLTNSEGTGTAMNPNRTYGMLEMGGASTQIGFFEPNGDVMANLFKLQIGAAKHWNVYAHSWLYFGMNGAYARLNARLFTEAMMNPSTDDKTNGIYNPCLPGGSEYLFTSRVHMLGDGTLLPLSSPENASILEADLYSAVMRNDFPGGNFDECATLVLKLLRKETNEWCAFAHDRDCSFAGIYQPPLPVDEADFGEFIATSNFYKVWKFLGLKSRSSLLQVRKEAKRVCSMSLAELQDYNAQLPNSISDLDELTQYCFRATFVSTFLIEGVGFPETYNVTALDVIDGRKVGWALGSMLYELNTLPWEFEGSLLDKVASKMLLQRFWSSDDESLLDSLDGGAGSLVLVLIVTVVALLKFVVSGRWTSRSRRVEEFGRNDEASSLKRFISKQRTDYGAT